MYRKILSIILLSLLVAFLMSSCGVKSKVIDNDESTVGKVLYEFQVVSPANNSENISITPLLSWQIKISGEASNSDLKYDVYYGESPDSVDKLVVEDLKSNSVILDEPLKYSTKYYWRVILKINGERIESPIWSFTTMQKEQENTNNNPPVFEQLLPKDGISDQPLNAVLKWRVVDPDPTDIVSCDLYFGTSRSNLELLSKNHPLDFYQFGVSNHPKLEYNKTYYWKVIARDSRGAVVSSKVMMFRTADKPNNPPENIVYLNPPENNWTYNYGEKIEVSWHSRDPDGDKLRYKVYFGQGDELKEIKSDYEESSITFSDLEPGRYSFRVDVTDGKSWVEGDVWNFTVSPSDPPFTPIPISPIGPGQPVRNLRFVWTAPPGHDPNRGDIRYRLYFDTRPNPALYKSEIMQNYFELPKKLEYGKTYYWRVEVYGTYFGISRTVSFSTAKKTRPTVNLLFPTNGSIIHRANIPLEWRVEDINNDLWKTIKIEYSKYGIPSNPKLYEIFKSRGYIHEITGPFACDWVKNSCSYNLVIGLTDATATYYWRVIVEDETSKRATSTVWIFTTLPN